SPPPPPKEPDLALFRRFSERIWGVLLAPFQTFRHHDPAWGWGQAWGLVAVAGILVGVIGLVQTDHDRFQEWQWQRVLAAMKPAQRKQVESPQAAEMIAKSQRFQAFFTKIGSVLGPPLLGLIGLVIAAGFLFLVGQILGKEPPDPMRCLSIAAFASLANLIDLAGAGVGAALASPLSRPDLSALVDPFKQPILLTALSRIGPGVLLYYLLLAAGLEGSMGLSRKRAVAVAAVTFLGTSAVLIGFVGLSQLVSGASS
ncbi:MAG: YIP1 family protein, partial [Planctomycetes bacterium]|nr:YIP1 family protein [Planctomycetota bacterium]